jgi:hypothetical protein
MSLQPTISVSRADVLKRIKSIAIRLSGSPALVGDRGIPSTAVSPSWAVGDVGDSSATSVVGSSATGTRRLLSMAAGLGEMLAALHAASCRAAPGTSEAPIAGACGTPGLSVSGAAAP